jgi:hypothetical protein
MYGMFSNLSAAKAETSFITHAIGSKLNLYFRPYPAKNFSQSLLSLLKFNSLSISNVKPIYTYVFVVCLYIDVYICQIIVSKKGSPQVAKESFDVAI